MSETNETTTTETEAATNEIETPSEKESRDRRSFPIRLFRLFDGGWLPVDAGPFAKIGQAEQWIKAQGVDDATYMMARVIGAQKVLPRRVEEVGL